ncbi:hypothetical protein GUJ93_ZPchr0006g42576 [Zizania palustris]|uniref:Uncharacterized protein n=1 Tax=Zizania palustris TaxID=103762 RepID=A0A8J5W337_ZIZPA|nr:hypothetical protein GUJ93_ZPchr0006g42576 [Zizania palustris]
MGSCPSSQESYVRLGRRRRRQPARGFRLYCPRNRFSVRRLRAKLMKFVGVVGRYVRQLLLAGRRRHSSKASAGGCSRSSSMRVLVVEGKHDGGRQTRCIPGAPSFMRSNSFYAQAIAECLEFIKRNSVPVEDYANANDASARRSIDLTINRKPEKAPFFFDQGQNS